MVTSEKDLYSVGMHKSPDASEGGDFTFGNLQLVGHGEQTRADCGMWVSTQVCLNLKGHEGCHFDRRGNLRDYTGQVFVRKRTNGCFKPSCPKCYKYKWSLREAKKIEHRLKEASKLLGKDNKKSGVIEHIIVSVPPSMYGLPYEVLRGKVVKGLENRLVFGGALIFHGARYLNRFEAWKKGVKEGWRLGIHFHVLGMIRGGFGCRGCKKSCKDGHCNGFKSRCYVEGMKDGLFVKVAVNKYGKAEERKSVFATALYELRHACIRTDVKRPHCATWFGSCSYRKMKIVKPVPERAKCPLCGCELVDGFKYFGSVDSPSGRFFAPLVENGVEVVRTDETVRWSGSGSYEDCEW